MQYMPGSVLHIAVNGLVAWEREPSCSHLPDEAPMLPGMDL